MINDIQLENFKGFRSQSIPFSNLTVFTGINGMGKSSCIQAILLLRQSFLLGRLKVDGGLALDGEYAKPGNGKDIFYIGADPSEKIKIGLAFSNDKNATFIFSYSKGSDLQPAYLIEHNFDLSSTSLFDDNFFYLNADRLSPERDVFPASQSSIEKGNLGTHGQYTVHYIANNQRKTLPMPSMKHPLAQTDNLLDNIDAWLKEIAPGIKVTPHFYPELNAARLGYSYVTEAGITDEFKPVNVGYGITYVLPIITQLLISKPGQCIVIENPESHLHPSAQSSVARLCVLAARNNVQVILETHSDHIINGILIAVTQNFKNQEEGIESDKVRIHFIDRDEHAHQSKLFNIGIEKNGRIRNAPVNFFDQFTKDMKTIMGF